MIRNVKEFIENAVKTGLVKRDLFIGAEVDKAYLTPLAEEWKEYGLGKREIIFLSIVIAHKYADQIKKNGALNCEKVAESGRPTDMGRLSDFSEDELTFLISVLISKYGIDDVVNHIGQRWEDLRVMAEQGLQILYCKIYKEKVIETEIFNTILNLDKELEI